MNDHTGCSRGFHWNNKAYYSSVIRQPEITFGMYDKEGGTSGEMSVVWEALGRDLVPELRVFDDGWNALSLFTDLLEKMAEVDNENVSQEKFVEMLIECGFEDLTRYERPYK